MTDNLFDNEIFKVKFIEFRGRNRSICMQSENGPCPLIAILNVLLLRGDIDLTTQEDFITGKEMINLVAEYLLTHCHSEDNVALHHILETFSQLNTGLMVNVKFNDVSSFEESENLKIFDCLKIKLYHCWVMDSDSLNDEHKSLRNLSYEQAVLSNIPDAWKENNLGGESERIIMVDFINDNSSMMTFQGVSQLHTKLDDDELSVLFYNNHFSVLYKRPSSNEVLGNSSNGSVNNVVLFLLCTDIGYHEPGTDWQALTSLSGDTEIVGSNFRQSSTPNSFDEGNNPNEDLDEKLARQLAMEDDQKMAEELQKQEDEAIAKQYDEEMNRRNSSPQTHATRIGGADGTTTTSSRNYHSDQRRSQQNVQNSRKKESECSIL